MFQTCKSVTHGSLLLNQAELVQPPSMMEKQAKAPKPKSEKKLKAAESPAPVESPVQTQPAQTIEGK